MWKSEDKKTRKGMAGGRWKPNRGLHGVRLPWIIITLCRFLIGFWLVVPGIFIVDFFLGRGFLSFLDENEPLYGNGILCYDKKRGNLSFCSAMLFDGECIEKEGNIIMTKINVISGFLGAGKTTLIKKMLQEVFCGQKMVLIENEFGEIGIDGGFLKDAGIEITEMNSGCICCSLVGDFGTALKEVLTKFAPDRIIIEPSGVGKLSDVMKAVERVAETAEVELDGSLTVADATKCKIYMKNFGEFFNNQIEFADTIVLSRTQNIKQEKLEACVKLLQEHNAKAAIITTPWEELDGKLILEAMNQKNSLAEELMQKEHAYHSDKEEYCTHTHHHNGEGHHHEEGKFHHTKEHHTHEEEHHHIKEEHAHEGHHHAEGEHTHEEEGHHHVHGEECGCGHDHEHHHHHHADEVFTSWGKETPHKYQEEDLKKILEVLANETGYGTILRAKGIVPDIEGNWLHFDLVPGEYEVRKGTADYTGRLCVIGSQLEETKLAELFQI